MKCIELNRGHVAIVDDEDFERVAQFRWFVCKKGYAKKNRTVKGGGPMKMHRFILNAPEGVQVDHKNHNKLDNRKENLRLATNAQNTQNRGVKRNNKLGMKGVCKAQKGGRYIAQISVGKKHHYLGRFDTPEQAKAAYNEAAVRLHGEFAHLN